MNSMNGPLTFLEDNDSFINKRRLLFIHFRIYVPCCHSTDTICVRWPNVGLMLRRRRWRIPALTQTLYQCFVFELLGIPFCCAWKDIHDSNCFPVDTRRWSNVGLTLVHRLRRWTNFKPTLIQRLVSAGLYLKSKQLLHLLYCSTGYDITTYRNLYDNTGPGNYWLFTALYYKNY